MPREHAKLDGGIPRFVRPRRSIRRKMPPGDAMHTSGHAHIGLPITAEVEVPAPLGATALGGDDDGEVAISAQIRIAVVELVGFDGQRLGVLRQFAGVGRRRRPMVPCRTALVDDAAPHRVGVEGRRELPRRTLLEGVRLLLRVALLLANAPVLLPVLAVSLAVAAVPVAAAGPSLPRRRPPPRRPRRLAGRPAAGAALPPCG
mmetsp:Transcript_61064/g.176918  ORF Transcript_61064/g.176918 Transcript_61064/m.176918 type:complete len:203 (-) Transcript_61064:178-786(-)